MRRKIHALIDAIWDRIFVAFLIIFACTLMAVIYLAELVFPKSVEKRMNDFFEPPKDENIVSGYRKFRDRHPLLAWLLKLPLLLFGI